MPTRIHRSFAMAPLSHTSNAELEGYASAAVKWCRRRTLCCQGGWPARGGGPRDFTDPGEPVSRPVRAAGAPGTLPTRGTRLHPITRVESAAAGKSALRLSRPRGRSGGADETESCPRRAERFQKVTRRGFSLRIPSQAMALCHLG